MSKMERLRWIPMLVDAYREAKKLQISEQIQSNTLITDVQPRQRSRSSEKPLPTAIPRPKRPSVAKISPISQSPSKNPKRPGSGVTSDNQRLIRELRMVNRKSLNRLDTIQKKLQDVEAKVEGLKEELHRAANSTNEVPKAAEQIKAANFPLSGLPPWP